MFSRPSLHGKNDDDTPCCPTQCDCIAVWIGTNLCSPRQHPNLKGSYPGPRSVCIVLPMTIGVGKMAQRDLWPGYRTTDHFMTVCDDSSNLQRWHDVRHILTTATLKGSVSCSAAIKVTVIHLGLVFDLHCYYLAGDHSLESHNSRAFFQWVNEDTCIKWRQVTLTRGNQAIKSN